MSDDTALAKARWRKRCAVKGVADALTELRIANRLLAEAEGRPLRAIVERLGRAARAVLGEDPFAAALATSAIAHPEMMNPEGGPCRSPSLVAGGSDAPAALFDPDGLVSAVPTAADASADGPEALEGAPSGPEGVRFCACGEPVGDGLIFSCWFCARKPVDL